MIGNAVFSTHPEQADQDHARRVQADAERHQRAEAEVAGDGDGELHAADADLVAPGREQAQLPHQHEARPQRAAPKPMPN